MNPTNMNPTRLGEEKIRSRRLLTGILHLLKSLFEPCLTTQNERFQKGFEKPFSRSFAVTGKLETSSILKKLLGTNTRSKTLKKHVCHLQIYFIF